MGLFDSAGILQKIFAAIPNLFNPVLISGQKQRWKDDFNGNLLSSDWVISKNTGNGSITVSQSEAIISTGTVAGITAIRSVKSFEVPCKVTFAFRASNRQASQTFKFGIIDESGNNYAWFVLSVTNVNTAIIQSANNNSLVAATTINLGVNTSNIGIVELDLTFDELKFSSLAPNTTAGKTQIVSRHTRIPSPNEKYFLEMEVENIGITTAGTLNIDFVGFQENEIIQSEVTAIRHNKNASDGLFISTFLPTANVNITTSIPIVVGNSISSITETVSNLGENAAFTGNVRNLTNKGVCIVSVFTTSPGTLFIDESPDGIFWITFPGYPCVEGGNSFKRELNTATIRVRYINGNTPTTTFRIYLLTKSF